MADERKTLVDALKKYHDSKFTPGVYEHSIFGKAALMLEQSVEVVRCKDCKHCYEAQFSSTGYRCKVWGVYDTDCEVTPNHFCSYGERGEGNG